MLVIILSFTNNKMNYEQKNVSLLRNRFTSTKMYQQQQKQSPQICICRVYHETKPTEKTIQKNDFRI